MIVDNVHMNHVSLIKLGFRQVVDLRSDRQVSLVDSTTLKVHIHKSCPGAAALTLACSPLSFSAGSVRIVM